MDKKIEFIKERKKSKRIKARFVRYHKGKIERGLYKDLDFEFPYVRIGNDDESALCKLNFGSQIAKIFKTGEEIDAFWSGNDLMYWNTYDRGLYKYLPEKWNFWQKDLL
ncbi:hypothetical protein POV27_16540 [Aureisphaera galaxeae]|uniref:hypothetical protein n=1 Tax=Aureisphaera galaxeae TaxID=1538023 RepID=UPI002350913C|nr:hypothetical protein [Aureisphaera galaxeae]MDC8005668.1 hypothetical protein [Aureisphaera galaxeae]